MFAIYVSFPQKRNLGLGYGLWCLMSLSTITQLYRSDKFYW
jgi:hypothetical protein